MKAWDYVCKTAVTTRSIRYNSMPLNLKPPSKLWLYFFLKKKLFMSWILGANRPVQLSLQIGGRRLQVAGTLETFKSELQPLWLWAAGNEQLSPPLRCLAAKQLVSSVARFWIIWGVPLTFLSKNLGSFGNVFIKQHCFPQSGNA